MNTFGSGDRVSLALQQNVPGVTMNTTNRAIGGGNFLIQEQPSKAQGNSQSDTTPNRYNRTSIMLKIICDTKRRLHSLVMRGELGDCQVIVGGDVHNKGLEGLDR